MVELRHDAVEDIANDCEVRHPVFTFLNHTFNANFDFERVPVQPSVGMVRIFWCKMVRRLKMSRARNLKGSP